MPKGYFSFRQIDRRRIGIFLERSLQDLVDRSAPITAIKFRLACRGTDGTTDYLPVTVSIEDINDNSPEFVNAPYRFSLDELTPPGLTVFRGIQALDKDKPNTANSEISFKITSGNDDRKFSIEIGGSGRAVLVLRKRLDYDKGDRLFNLTIEAQDHGSPSYSTSTYVLVNVEDGDDLNPKFTQPTYRVNVFEHYPITVS